MKVYAPSRKRNYVRNDPDISLLPTHFAAHYVLLIILVAEEAPSIHDLADSPILHKPIQIDQMGESRHIAWVADNLRLPVGSLCQPCWTGYLESVNLRNVKGASHVNWHKPRHRHPGRHPVIRATRRATRAKGVLSLRHAHRPICFVVTANVLEPSRIFRLPLRPQPVKPGMMHEEYRVPRARDGIHHLL